MANQEHLDILKQGVEAWNQWRQEHTDVRANLEVADLNSALLNGTYPHDADLNSALFDYGNLRHADLSGASLRATNLEGANLSATNLEGANLSYADLSYAYLRDTNLNSALLSHADLSHADLSHAELNHADLSSANLSGANLSYAYLRDTNLNSANLSHAYLYKADLFNANLSHAHLSGATLTGADLRGASLLNTKLSHAHLREAILSIANLSSATLTGADLSYTDLKGANLRGADLEGADLSHANLKYASLVGTNLSKATLSQCSIYGISAWNIKLEGATQVNLVITRDDEPTIIVDNLEVAQFIYLLLNHKKLRAVLNAVTERGVLLLGRFGGGGLEVLQAIAAKLREEKYLPIIFDFERPKDRNYTETIKTLAGLARFVIADLSGPSVPQELYATVPHFKIPFVPIIEASKIPFSLSIDLLEYPWVVRPPVTFTTTEELLEQLPARVIAPAEEKHQARQKLLSELFNQA